MVTLAQTGEPLEGAAFEAPCYRIPAMAVTPTGRIIVAWDVRADWRDIPGPFDLVYRTSDDNGTTWSDVRPLRQRTDAGGFGDASFIVAPDGTVLCWYVGSTGRSFFTADAGPDGEGLTLWLATSVDDGETWTGRDLTDCLKPADITGMFASSGNGALLSSGRLLQPFVLRTGDGRHFAAIACSDDNGDTWSLGERIGPDCDENKAVELADGGVLLHARARPRRRWALSSDGGETFSDPLPNKQLVDPACNGGLARWATTSSARSSTTPPSAAGSRCASATTAAAPGRKRCRSTPARPPTPWPPSWPTAGSLSSGRRATTPRSSSPPSAATRPGWPGRRPRSSP